MNSTKLNKKDLKIYLKGLLCNLSYVLKNKSHILKSNFIIGLSKIYCLFPDLFSSFLIEGFIKYIKLFHERIDDNPMYYKNVEHILKIFSKFFVIPKLSYDQFKEIINLLLKLYEKDKKGYVNNENMGINYYKHYINKICNDEKKIKEKDKVVINDLITFQNMTGLENSFLEKGYRSNSKQSLITSYFDIDRKVSRNIKEQEINNNNNDNINIYKKEKNILETADICYNNQNNINGFIKTAEEEKDILERYISVHNNSLCVCNLYISSLSLLCCKNYEHCYKYFLYHRNNERIFFFLYIIIG